MHVTFSFAFFPDMPLELLSYFLHTFSMLSHYFVKVRTSNFHKVVRQHTEGMEEVLYGFCRKFTSLLQQLKNFENPLIIDKVIAMSLVYYFLGHSVFKRNTIK